MRIRFFSFLSLSTIDNAKKSVRIFLDCLWFFHLLHLKFSDQIQHLHPFDPFISFVFLLKKIPNFLGCFPCHYSGKNCIWGCCKQGCSCFWFFLLPVLLISDLCKSWIVWQGWNFIYLFNSFPLIISIKIGFYSNSPHLIICSIKHWKCNCSERIFWIGFCVFWRDKWWVFRNCVWALSISQVPQDYCSDTSLLDI